MTNINQSVFQQLLRETAESYIHKGCEVVIEPHDEHLPDFLKGSRPDMIVRTPEGNHIVVEVKVSDRTSFVEHWQQLQRTVASHPGWRLELIVKNQREEELRNALQPLLSREEIEARLCAGQQLVEQGFSDSALLIGWSALEAFLHYQNHPETLTVATQSPAALLSTSVSQGDLGYDDYDALTKVLRSRNQVAHGRHADDAQQAFEQLYQITQRLLENENEMQAAA